VSRGIKRDRVEMVRTEEGKLTLAETLRDRVTYLTAGAAVLVQRECPKGRRELNYGGSV
jgi:hypothetical protein